MSCRNLRTGREHLRHHPLGQLFQSLQSTAEYKLVSDSVELKMINKLTSFLLVPSLDSNLRDRLVFFSFLWLLRQISLGPLERSGQICHLEAVPTLKRAAIRVDNVHHQSQQPLSNPFCLQNLSDTQNYLGLIPISLELFPTPRVL